MLIEIDFNSDEALYVQLQNQIIMGIATATIQEGESLPSVRQLADTVGINMHTVNKAYSILKQEGFIQLDRRRGAVIAIDADKAKAYAEVKRALRIALAKGSLKNVSREEVHEMVDELFDEYGGKDGWKIEKCYVKDDSNREMLDIIAGKFFIAYAPIESEKFLSMPKELARKYEEKFKYPERFYKSLDGIEAKPYKPVSKDMER